MSASTSAKKGLAIVLRVIDFSESSCVVNLFTREHGKVSALAKGARRPKSPFEAALDLLAVCRVVFLPKSSDALDLLTEAKLQRRFRAAARDLGRLYAGYYVIELLRELTDRDDPHPELFDVAQRAVIALDEEGEVAGTVFHFELNALRILGHLPSLDQCVECSASLVNESRVAFGQLAGGVLCPRCRQGKRQVVSVGGATVQAMRQLARQDADPNTAGMVWRGELRGLLNHYFNNLLGHRPRMQTHLAGMIR